MKQLLQDNSEEKETVIAMVEAVGQGKTALAKLIFDDVQVQAPFDLHIWVDFTGAIFLEDIARKIFASVTNADPGHLSIVELLSLIRQEILEKSSLLILDDVWNVQPKNWIELRWFLCSGETQSRIIVTTRDEEVGRITASEEHTHWLTSLDDNSSWSLFKQVAFETRAS